MYSVSVKASNDWVNKINNRVSLTSRLLPLWTVDCLFSVKRSETSPHPTSANNFVYTAVGHFKIIVVAWRSKRSRIVCKSLHVLSTCNRNLKSLVNKKTSCKEKLSTNRIYSQYFQFTSIALNNLCPAFAAANKLQYFRFLLPSKTSPLYRLKQAFFNL